MRARAALAVVVALLATSAATHPASAGTGFADVPVGTYYDTAADWLRGEGITTGYGGATTVFAPDVAVTRAQMAVFLWRLSGSPSAPASGFTDIPAGSFYAGAVAWLKDVGLTTGYAGDAARFAPDVVVTRAQMAAFLWRLSGSPGAGPSGFGDVPAGAYFATAAAWLKAQGISTGYGGDPTRFAPDVVVTRAQMAAFLWRRSGSPDPKVAYGTTVSAAIAVPGERDTYRIAANNGDRLSIDTLSGSVLIKLKLVAPNGAVVWSDADTSFTDRFVDLTQTGTYQLTLSYGAANYTGAYTFLLSNQKNPESFSVSLPTTVSNGVPVAGMGNIERPGASDRYQFTASSGDRLSLDTLSGSVLIKVRLVAPNGAVVWSDTSTSFTDRFVDLTQTGTYQLTLSYGDQAYTGTYSFLLSNQKDPEAFNLSLGTTVSNGVPSPGMGNIERPGASDRYQFTASSGDRLSLDTLGGSVLIKVRLVAPNGAVVWSDTSTSFTDRFVDLTQTGTYQLTLSYGDQAYTGTYSFLLTAA